MFTKEKTRACKGFAILMLLFHHLYQNEGRVALSGVIFDVLPYRFVRLVAVGCRICVWLFVFISAYGLTLSYHRYGTEQRNNFFVIRWISLMSQYWPAFLFMWVSMTLTGVDVWKRYGANLLNVVINAFALSDLFGTPTLSGAWWYMCLAQVIVVLIPLACWYCDRIPLTTGMFLGFIALQYMGDGIHSDFGGYYSNYLLCVLLGCYAAKEELFDKVHEKVSKHETAALTAMSMASVAGIMISYKLRDSDIWHLRSLIQAIVAFCMLFVMSKLADVLPQALTKGLQLLGDHSGNMFLIHTLFYSRLPQFVYWSKNPVLSFAMLIVLSLSGSFALEKMKSMTGYCGLVNRAVRAVSVSGR